MAKSKKGKGMSTDESKYTYGAAENPFKKKRVVKLSRKQLKRKDAKRARGEKLVDRYAVKLARDVKSQARRLAAKELW